MLKPLYIYLLGLGALICYAFATQPEGAVCQTLDYIDGNNNTYHVTNDSVIYTPISPENSSSGIYSGGDAWSKKIDNEVRFEIENRLWQHVSQKENVLKNRTKPSVLIIFNYEKKTKKYIAKVDQELDDYFKSLKTTSTFRIE